MRRTTVVVVAALAVVSASCQGTAAPESTWTRVDVGGGALTRLQWDSFGAVVVSGRTREGRPLLALVNPGDDTPRGEVDRAELEGEGGVTSLAAAGSEAMAVTVDRDGSPRVWWGYVPQLMPRELPADGRGRVPDRVWVAFSDERYQLLGAMTEDERSVLYPVSSESGAWLTGPPQLYLHPSRDADELVVTGDEANLVVAGPVTDDPDAVVPEVQLWTTYDDAHAWQRRPLTIPLAGVTDGRGWALGSWVAGHTRDHRPVVLDQDGEPIDVPDVTLDGEHPMVFIARTPHLEGLALALQTPNGPAVHIADRDRWTVVAAPDGALAGAVLTDGPTPSEQRLFVLVDGSLWWRPVPH